MLKESQARLLALAARSARVAGAPAEAAPSPSILLLAAASYGSRPIGDTTIPTGFDPIAVTLFEAIIEAAYLVATADGSFDDEERRVFEAILGEACGGAVAPPQIVALLADLQNQIARDGVERRVANLSVGQSRKEHAQEVLRVGALVAQASHGVSSVERDLLVRIAASFGLGASDVEAAIVQARTALTSKSADATGPSQAAPDSRR